MSEPEVVARRRGRPPRVAPTAIIKDSVDEQVQRTADHFANPPRPKTKDEEQAVHEKLTLALEDPKAAIEADRKEAEANRQKEEIEWTFTVNEKRFKDAPRRFRYPDGKPNTGEIRMYLEADPSHSVPGILAGQRRVLR